MSSDMKVSMFDFGKQGVTTNAKLFYCQQLIAFNKLPICQR